MSPGRQGVSIASGSSTHGDPFPVSRPDCMLHRGGIVRFTEGQVLGGTQSSVLNMFSVHHYSSKHIYPAEVSPQNISPSSLVFSRVLFLLPSTFACGKMCGVTTVTSGRVGESVSLRSGLMKTPCRAVGSRIHACIQLCPPGRCATISTTSSELPQ